MKNMKALYCLMAAAATICFAACEKTDETPSEKTDETPSELCFSVNESNVSTDGIEYSFDILSGAGGYDAQINCINEYDEYATATVSGNTVTVQLVSNATSVKVTDKAGHERDLVIWSTNSTLQQGSHLISFGYGFDCTGKFTFGSGEGYSIIETRGDRYVTLTVDENGDYHAIGLHPGGSTTFVVRDGRGTVNNVNVGVRNGWDLEESSMTVNALPGYIYTCRLKWGEGNIRITDSSDEVKSPFLLIDNAKDFGPNKVLQVRVNDGATGEFFVELTDAANNKARLTLVVDEK
jgi:hypothetical protein